MTARPSHVALVAAVLRRSDRLSNWERRFCWSIARQGSITAKQRATLDRIIARAYPGAAA